MKYLKCPKCSTPLTLAATTYTEEEVLENELNIEVSLYMECRNIECGHFFAEYGIMPDDTVAHIDGSEPFKTLYVKPKKELNMKEFGYECYRTDNFPEEFDSPIHPEHLLTILKQEGIDYDDPECLIGERKLAVSASLSIITHCSWPSYYVCVLARILKDTGNPQAIHHFNKMLLAMDGNDV